MGLKGDLVLVTGGAGFIGSHLVDLLLRSGCRVRVLDAILPQVHPTGPPSYLDREAELQQGDVRDGDVVERALAGVDAVVHLAALVGVGQSMYEPVRYCSINVMGTATVLEAVARSRRELGRLLVASSMSLYGEGLYRCTACGPQSPALRPTAQLAARDWAVHCPGCGRGLEPMATPEGKPAAPTSIYSINKRDQEEMVLTLGRSLQIPAVALRFFNVYGDRQALSNPYTGVAAIFSSALLNGEAPRIFEDGLQARDFVHVSDVVEACRLSLERDDVAGEVFNVGTGQPTSLLELVALLRQEIPGAAGIEPEMLGRFREGDIRACFADISRAQERLGYAPRVPLAEGVRGLAAWVASQKSPNRSSEALAELSRHGLIR